MTKYIAKKQNHTALFLTNMHANFEDSIKALRHIQYTQNLAIQDDLISKQHVRVLDLNQPQRFIRIEKQDILMANTDRQALYHLFATVLNELGSKS